MLELGAEVLDMTVDRYGASPNLCLKLRLTESSGAAVSAIALRAQVRIEPQHRQYVPHEAERLREIFGEPSQWSGSLRPFLWSEVSKTVGQFTGTTEIDIGVPCTYDLEVATGKYFHALEGGEIPLLLLFSGTVFRVEAGRLAVEPVPWHLEARHRLPAARWRELMDVYFPGSCWLRLPRTTVDALARFKADKALSSFEQAIETLLEAKAASR
ncbi:MAG: DUF6084 family protein [Acidimicrobiales bacterium]